MLYIRIDIAQTVVSFDRIGRVGLAPEGMCFTICLNCFCLTLCSYCYCSVIRFDNSSLSFPSYYYSNFPFEQANVVAQTTTTTTTIISFLETVSI